MGPPWHDDSVRAPEGFQTGIRNDLDTVIRDQRPSWMLGANDNTIPGRTHIRQAEYFYRKSQLESVDAVIGEHRDCLLSP